MKVSNAFGHLLLAGCALIGLTLAACDPDAKHPEYTGNGQGGVQIRPVPYMGGPPQPDPSAATQPTRSDSLETQIRQQQTQIDSLEDLIHRQDDEIRQLKGQPPATLPAVH